MHNDLIQLIEENFVLSDQDKALCASYFEPVFFPKNHVIEEEAKTPKYLYFIVSGFLRLFHYNDNGDEITTHINCPPGFITSYSNFIQQTQANENLECVTACELLRISKNSLDLLILESAPLKNFSIWVFQKSLVYNENRAKELATLSAEQRYQKLIKTHPDILQHVPLQYIASFLGMNPKSLSRIRKQIIR
jgi:CRP/FNR family transcriptional regulator, anaerobic regulatory protein